MENRTGHPAIRLDQVTRRFGAGHAAVMALGGISIDIWPGEFTAIMGPSGSGKSTLLHLIGALDKPTSGQIFASGRDVSRLSAAEAARYRRREVGFMFQSFNLLPRMTVLENVALPLMLDGVSTGERERRAGGLLGDLGLGDRLAHRPAELSGGEMQRTALARAMVMKPSIVLADEPTGNLDSRNAAAALTLMKQLNEERGQTIVMITHDPNVAAHARRTVQMQDGLIRNAA